MTTHTDTIALSEWELDNLHLPPVTTLTFYEGPAPVASLRSRVALLLSENPWLAARLVRKGTQDKKVALSVEPLVDVDTVVDAYFKVYEKGQIGLSSGLGYREIVSRILPIQCARSKPSTDEDEPLFRVAVVPLEGGPRSSAGVEPVTESTLMQDVNLGGFALMVSMNHTLGDGHTYYSLYNMLSADSEVRALEPTRVQGFEDEKADLIGAKESAFLTSPGLGLGIVGTYLLGKVSRRGPQHVSLHVLDQALVDAQKEQARAEGEVPFVSTNDVVTSWFLGEMGSDANLMLANFRSRTPPIGGLGEERAGNYEANIPYFPGDVESAALIRESIQSADGTFRARRAGTPTTAIPGFFKMLRSQMSIITNWAGFYRDLELASDDGEASPPLSPELHLPIMESDGMITSIWNNAIIFALGQDRLGILLITRSAHEAAVKPGSGPLGRSVI